MAKRTPLYETHIAYGGRIVDFAGWELPVQYAGINSEHMAVRRAAGLFDVSHMGEIAFRGKGAEAQLQHLLTNDIATMAAGDVRYSPMCYGDGGTVDDVLVYKLAQDDFLVVVNASNADKDFSWMTGNNSFGAAIGNLSDQYAQLALQGPKAEEILRALDAACPLPTRYYTFNRGKLIGKEGIISRTGYTGEDGFELYLRPEDAPEVWEALMEAGRGFSLAPAGLGARDTLRLEAAMPLYGHELSAAISPLEAGLGRFVKTGKEDFLGREALLRQKTEGVKARRFGLQLLDRGIAREGAKVFSGGEEIGAVTSGTKTPLLERPIAMAMLPSGCAVGDRVEVDIRGKKCAAEIVKLPFYKR